MIDINFNAKAEKKQYFCVSDVLLHERENRLSLKELCTILQEEGRTIRKQIEFERRNGALILSCSKSGGGYFLPSLDPEQARVELLNYYKSMMKRAKMTISVLRPVRLALKVVDGQTSMPEVTK